MEVPAAKHPKIGNDVDMTATRYEFEVRATYVEEFAARWC